MIDNPHDAFFKLIFSQPEHAAGELRAILPPELSARIDWKTLAHHPGSFVDEALSQSHTDLLFTAQLDGGPVFLYFLFEHLSTVQPLVPFRMLRYEVRIWDDWLSKNPGEKRLPPILPVVLHHSEAGWRGPTDFQDLLDIGPATLELLAPFVPHFRVVLDDISKTTDEALRRRAMTALGTVALWCLRDVRKRGVLLRNLGLFADLVADVLTATNGLAAIGSVLRYILFATEKPTNIDEKELYSTLRRVLASVEEAKMETLWDHLQELYMERGIERGLKRGEERGLKQGEERGLARGRREMLLRLLRSRFGEPSDATQARVNGADIPTLDRWADRVLTARTLDEVWCEPPE